MKLLGAPRNYPVAPAVALLLSGLKPDRLASAWRNVRQKCPSFFTQAVPRAGRLYISTIIAAGVMVLSLTACQSISLQVREWIPLLLLTALAGQFTIRLPMIGSKIHSVSVSMGDIFIFTALFFFGPPAAVIVAVVEGLVTQLRVKIRKLHKFFFNLGQLSLTAFTVGHVFYLIEGSGWPLERIEHPIEFLLKVGLCGLLYFALNAASIAAGVCLSTGRSFRELWKESFAWAWVTHLASAWVGALTFLWAMQLSFTLLLAVPTMVLIYYAFKLNQNRMLQTHKNLEQVRELLQEKIEAEKALQKAKDELEFRVQERTRELSQVNQQLKREVQERKGAEAMLAAEKERLAVTLRSIGEGVIATDTEGRVRLVNAEAEALTGWRQDNALGLPMSEVFKTISAAVPAENEKSPADLQSAAGRKVLISKSGARHRISSAEAPIQNETGEVIGTVLIFRDISYQSKIEEELYKAQKLESLGLLAGGIAHDFNNILSGILLASQLASRAVARDEDVTKLLVCIEEATLRASGLTNQLLTFAKGGAPIKEASSLGELALESAEFVLRGSKSRCVSQIPNDLWMVEVDRGQFNQVVNNLVLNAKEAMPEGGTITLRAENLDASSIGNLHNLPKGDCVRLEVQDQGSGIPPENLERIFDPYFTTKSKGHGLGLASTYSIVKKHGGTIKVDSEVGKGTTFSIYIPASGKAHNAARFEEESSVAGKGRILIMDDMEDIRRCCAQLLEGLGYEADTVEDGEAAIAVYQRALQQGRRYDALIMDLTIPGGMGGKETIAKIQHIDPSVRAIVTSGYSDSAILSDFRSYGFCAMLPKPFRLGDLSRALKEIMAERADRRPQADLKPACRPANCGPMAAPSFPMGQLRGARQA